MEKDLFKNSYNDSYKESYKKSPMDGMNAFAPGKPSGRSDEELVREFMEMSVWDAMEKSKSMSEVEKIDMLRAVGKHEGAKELKPEQLDWWEKTLLIAPNEVVHPTALLLASVLSKVGEGVDGDADKLLESIPGSLGKRMNLLQKRVDDDADAYEKYFIPKPEWMRRMNQSLAEYDQCIAYAQMIKEKFDYASENIGKKQDLYQERHKQALQAALTGGIFYSGLIGILERRRAHAEKLLNNGDSLRTSDQNSRLKTLQETTPGRMRWDVQSGSVGESTCAALKEAVSGMIKGDQVDAFEHFLWLGAGEVEISAVLPGMRDFFRQGVLDGWLGEEIADLKDEVKRTPKKGSMLGMLAGLLLIALSIGLAALLYTHPGVKEAAGEYVTTVVVIGFVLSFMVGKVLFNYVVAFAAPFVWAFLFNALSTAMKVDPAAHILLCLQALAPAAWGIRRIRSSTPSVVRKKRAEREEHISSCRSRCDGLAEYVDDAIARLGRLAATPDGRAVKAYYETAAREIRRIRPS